MKLFKKKPVNAPRRRQAEVNLVQTTSSDVFKRNRTLTGTTSSRLSSAGSKNDLESSRSHIHHLSNQRRKLSVVLALVVVSIILVWLLVSNFTAEAVVRVSDTNISKSVDDNQYEESIQDYLNIHPLQRFTFLLDKTALAAYVTDKLPEVLSIDERGMESIGQIVFSIKMRQPVAGWRINDRQYYVDSQGIPFEQNYFDEPSVQIVDNSGVSVNSTSTTAIVSKRFLSFVGRVVSLSNANGYVVSQAILPANTTRELQISLQGSGFLVKLSIDRPAGEQIEDMSNALRYFASHGISPQTTIDVRVSGKAFYK